MAGALPSLGHEHPRATFETFYRAGRRTGDDPNGYLHARVPPSTAKGKTNGQLMAEAWTEMLEYWG